MLTGDIYLIRSRTIWGKLIRFWTRGKFSHAGIVLNDRLGVEATIRGVKVVKLPKEHVTLMRAAEPLTQSEIRIMRAFLIKELGKPYDFWAIAGFIFFKRWQHPHKWQCFELVWKTYEAMDRKLGRLDNDHIDGRLIYASLSLNVVKEQEVV